MDYNWLNEAERIAPEITALRRAFHAEPELGNREFATAAQIETFLRGCGVRTRRVLDTAVVGTLRGALPGPTVALRADMDALPVTEATGARFASRTPGVMHACGHDVHMAAVLGAAKLLSAHVGELAGSVVFLFEPDEEGSGGAERMIEQGALEGVGAVFGCHVSPELPAGHAGVRFGKFYAASDTFCITLTGKSAHGAEREKGIDALAAAAKLVEALLALPASLHGERSVVSVGTLRAGTAINVVADKAELTGIIRTLGPEARSRMRELLARTAEAVAADTGVIAQLDLHESYPGVVNDDGMTALVQRAAEDLLGAARVHDLPEPTMTTEDFGVFLQHRPGSFYHLGAGCAAPLHSPEFLPDQAAAVTGAALHAAVVTTYLDAYGK